MDDGTGLGLSAYLTHPHPSVRVCAYLALERGREGEALLSDRARLLEQPPVRQILAAQYPDGYWMHRDLGVSPRYRATVWQVLFLAQLGVGPAATPPGAPGGGALPVQIRRALESVLRDNRDGAGALRLRQDGPSPALTGAVLWAVGRMGATHAGDWSATWTWATAHVAQAGGDTDAAVWMIRAAHVWGRPDWLATHAPWRAVTWPSPADAQLTFPLALRPDLLAMMEMACEAGRPELIPEEAVAWLAARRLPSGAWPLDRTPGRLWCDAGTVGTANPWVSVRALSVLTQVTPAAH